MTKPFNYDHKNGLSTWKIVYVHIYSQQYHIFDKHMFSERLFDQCWPPGLNKNIGTFKITAAMLNQKDQ